MAGDVGRVEEEAKSTKPDPSELNCRGSSQYALDIYEGDTDNLIKDFYSVLTSGLPSDVLAGGPIDPASIYRSAKHIVCARSVYSGAGGGSICLFMQGNVPEAGMKGSVIVSNLSDLIHHGCRVYGRVPLGANNEPSLMGELTSNYVHSKGCLGLCLQNDYLHGIIEGIARRADADESARPEKS